MPLTAFVDKQVFDELEKINGNKKNNEESLFPEHEFLVSCLRMGLKLEDLKVLTYVDVLKILISFVGEDNKVESKVKNGVREATQEDIERMVAIM